MAVRLYTVGAYSSLYTSDIGYLVYPNGATKSTTKVIVYFHGRGGSGYSLSTSMIEPHVRALNDAGYAVFGLDHARINSWGDPDAMRATYEAVNTYLPGLGFSTASIGAFGNSMGGLTGLNFIARYPSQVKCGFFFNPATDTRFFNEGSGSYTPTYGVSTSTSQGIWGASGTNEIPTTFGPSTNAVGTATIPASGGSGVTVTVTTNTAKSFADALTFGGLVALPRATASGVAFTYTGKTDSTLTGCVSTTASPISITNGLAITTAYATQSPGYIPWNTPSLWAGTGAKVRIVQASDDDVVEPNMNIHGTNGFVARVGHADVTLRSPNPTGGHLTSMTNFPTSEVVAFFQANL
jgi:pimeloyl-ACP methyl ester carboxylesterase